jgi:hypothetical protein
MSLQSCRFVGFTPRFAANDLPTCCLSSQIKLSLRKSALCAHGRISSLDWLDMLLAYVRVGAFDGNCDQCLGKQHRAGISQRASHKVTGRTVAPTSVYERHRRLFALCGEQARPGTPLYFDGGFSPYDSVGVILVSSSSRQARPPLFADIA